MTRNDRVGTHKTYIVTVEGKTMVVYHTTAVVTFDYDTIILDTGGWSTNTTKTRMNQASKQFGLGYYVYQKDYEWYVEYQGETIRYQGLRMELQRKREHVTN